MSLSTVQQVLARIYTDSKLRDDFLTNPDVVGVSLGLNCQEISQLSKLSTQQVNLFANSLKHKRLGEIRKLLPLTNKALGKDFQRLFFEYCETYLPTGSKKHLLDAITFIQFLLQRLTTDNTQAVWVLDLLRYEKIRLKMFEGKRFFMSDRFNYHLELLINSLNAEPQAILNPQPTIGIWFQLTPNSQWGSLFIPLKPNTKS